MAGARKRVPEVVRGGLPSEGYSGGPLSVAGVHKRGPGFLGREGGRDDSAAPDRAVGGNRRFESSASSSEHVAVFVRQQRFVQIPLAAL